jgi:hypothetical protein
LAEHDARAHEKQRIAMDRMEQKHARQVKLALEKDRIERDGELRSQTRIARQASAQLQKVEGEHIVLTEELDSVVKKNNAMAKTIRGERRQADVDRQTWFVYAPNPYTFHNCYQRPYSFPYPLSFTSCVGQVSVVIWRQV